MASGPSRCRASAASASSWPTWTPSAPQAAASSGVVVDDEEGAVGVVRGVCGERGQLDLPALGSDFSRSWTMSTPPLSAALSRVLGSPPRGCASQTK